MMNVFSDILCDTPSLATQQIINHNATNHQSSSTLALQSYDVPQGKISLNDLSARQGQLPLLQSVSHMSSFDQSLNHSSPADINLYNSASQIHIPSNLDSGFEEHSNVSVFSDSFPEIVPSWLTHDFMKASENLSSPSILSNVNDIYPSARESNHLEMLDLNFPPELTAQNMHDCQSQCDISKQKISEELPMQRFSNSESLIVQPFSMNGSQFHLPMTKNDLPPHSFKSAKSSVNHQQSLMNSMLPCSDDLIHLPLTSAITEQCLSSSSPSMISNSQSQSHIVCDKLPPLSLNQLDSFLGNDPALSDMQLLGHNFSDVRLAESNNHQPSIDVYNPNVGLLNSILQPDLPQFKDASVQASIEVPASKSSVNSPGCSSCTDTDPHMPVDIVQCFKCKHCDFVSLHTCSIMRHMKAAHSKMPRPSSSETNQQSSKNEIQDPKKMTNPKATVHIQKILPKEPDAAQEPVKIMNSDQKQSYSTLFQLYNSKMQKLQKTPASKSSNRLILPKEPDEDHDPVKVKKPWQKKTHPKTPQKETLKKSAVEKSLEKIEKNVSFHKKAWQKKMTRELGTYICESKGCNVRFRAIDNLEYHRKCHGDGVKTFICPECGANFLNWGAMAGHLWRSHGNDMELQKCDQCPFRTFSLSRLENIHKKIHGDECPYLCDTCGKNFKNGKQLRNHKVKHTSKNSNKCNLCEAFFADKDALKRHISNHHLKIKPFQCKYCEHSASTKASLVVHMRKHTGERPFKCDECDYSSADHNTLRRHKETHSGYKPYKCPLCSYSTNQVNRFKVHLLTIHEDQSTGLILTCNLCSFKTIKEEFYKKHMYEHEMSLQLAIPTPETPSSDNFFPSVEAMDASLSPTDSLLSSFSKHKNLQSFFNNLNVNIVSVGHEGLH